MMHSPTDTRFPIRSGRQVRGFVGRAATRFWPAADAGRPPRASIVMIPGRGESVDSYERTAVRLAIDDVYATIRLGATPDVVVGSVHAITENGHLVVGSASGSQFSPYASGARRAIWVVGTQKVVGDPETALRRIRTYSLPREHQRLADLYGQSSFIGRILILEREAFPERGTVILVRESIGF